MSLSVSDGPDPLAGTHVAKHTRRSRKSDTSANPGFGAKLWVAFSATGNNLDAIEYTYVVLELIARKRLSDAREAKHVERVARAGDGANAKDPGEYQGLGRSRCPPETRWQLLHSWAFTTNPPALRAGACSHG